MKPMRRQNQNVENWSPFDQLFRFRSQINRFFEGSPFSSSSDLLQGWDPAVDIYEDKDSFKVKAELPGMKKENINVSIHGSTLTISGERQSEEESKEGECCQSERYYGRFQRSIDLGQPVHSENVSATYKDGILQITLPKTEDAKRKQIQVQTTDAE